MKIEKHKLGREKKGVIQNSIYWFVGLKLAEVYGLNFIPDDSGLVLLLL